MGNIIVASESDVPDLNGLNRGEVKHAIRQWFLSNFEDPAENTPHVSQQGGYQFVWGGPYDARHEITDAFYHVPQSFLPLELIDEIVEDLEYTAWEWAPKRNRIYDEELFEHVPGSPYEQVQRHLEQIERLMAKIEPASSRIGHNRPPEALGVPPYSDEDKYQIQAAIKQLRRPEEELVSSNVATYAAAAVLRSHGEKLKEFFTRHGDKFVESFAKQLGRRAADSLTIALWIALSTSLISAANAIFRFLEAHQLVPF